MIGTGPIRISTDEWVVIRSNPNVPAAVIRLIDRGQSTEHYRVVSFDLVPALRKLIGRYRTLEAANDAVRYTAPVLPQLPPNGLRGSERVAERSTDMWPPPEPRLDS